MSCREKEIKHWSRRQDVRLNKKKTRLICRSVERLEGKQITSFFMGCERALLAEKKKNTLCIISLSLGRDKPGPMQREKWGQKKGSIWAATILRAGRRS